MRSKDPDSWLYQTPGMEASHIFHELTGIETRVVDSPINKNEEKEVLTGVLKELKEEFQLDAICAGALLSDYQRMIFTHAALDADLISYTPIWRKDGKQYMKNLLEFGFKFILLSYASEGFRPSDLGSVVDEKALDRFFSLSEKWGSHPAFEGGEAETLVLEAPLYQKMAKVSGEIEEEGPFRARYMIEEVSLE
jgi:uncharacterized protein (TIGR00290 family)